MRYKSPDNSGQHFKCIICNSKFYRPPSRIIQGGNKTCSWKCRIENLKGSNNPFWNKSHSRKTKSRISQNRKGKCFGNTNATGYNHTTKAKEKISRASKKLWTEHRNKMLKSLPRGIETYWYKPPELRRHRIRFSPRQKRELISDKCFYCNSKENLVLDHIIPVFDKGTNHDSNAQTLCQTCNLWKIHFVDLPRYYSRLGR